LFGPPPREHKRQRQTAREVYRRQRAKDIQRAEQGRETRVAQVLRILAWHWNVTQESPTSYELFRWATARGERLLDVNSIRPRINQLVARGLVEPRGKRRCRVSGEIATTWAVREAGSAEAR
jgi:hypothetical protein